MSDNPSNIVYFGEKDTPIKFVTLPVWIDYVFYNNENVEKKQFALIGLKDAYLDVHVIHPISQFIMDFWKNNQFNTQRKHCNNVVKFLNYLHKNRRKLNINTLEKLTLGHGNQYLNDLVLEGVSKETVKDAERTLTYFYRWLSKLNCVPNIPLDSFVRKESHYGSYYESPFQPIYPAKQPKRIEHTLPLSYIPLLLEVAISVSKPIALGIYFQVFGGLRVSEVVNLRRTQVRRRMRDGDFILNLKNQSFRTDLKENASVKKTRNQRVFQINDWGSSLFKDHIELFKPADGSDALFVNRDGKALSQRSYRQYFDKVKQNFIQLLENHGDNEQKLFANHLKYMKWSTHIGRGTFTNMIAEYAENPYEISLPRGDSNINSSLTYMVSTERLHKKIENKFSNMYKSYIPKLIMRE